MSNDHPLQHPEDARRFLTYFSGYSLGLVLVLWLWAGAALSKLPSFGLLAGFFVAFFAWWPIVLRMGWASLQELHEAKSIFHSARTLSLWVGFFVWGATLAAFTILILRGLPQ